MLCCAMLGDIFNVTDGAQVTTVKLIMRVSPTVYQARSTVDRGSIWIGSDGGVERVTSRGTCQYFAKHNLTFIIAQR